MANAGFTSRRATLQAPAVKQFLRCAFSEPPPPSYLEFREYLTTSPVDWVEFWSVEIRALFTEHILRKKIKQDFWDFLDCDDLIVALFDPASYIAEYLQKKRTNASIESKAATPNNFKQRLESSLDAKLKELLSKLDAADKIRKELAVIVENHLQAIRSFFQAAFSKKYAYKFVGNISISTTDVIFYKHLYSVAHQYESYAATYQSTTESNTDSPNDMADTCSSTTEQPMLRVPDPLPAPKPESTTKEISKEKESKAATNETDVHIDTPTQENLAHHELKLLKILLSVYTSCILKVQQALAQNAALEGGAQLQQQYQEVCKHLKIEHTSINTLNANLLQHCTVRKLLLEYVESLLQNQLIASFAPSADTQSTLAQQFSALQDEIDPHRRLRLS